MIGEGVADRQRGDCPPQQRIGVGNGRKLDDQFGWLAEVTVNTPWFSGIPPFSPGHLHAGVVAEQLRGEASGSSVTVLDLLGRGSGHRVRRRLVLRARPTRAQVHPMPALGHRGHLHRQYQRA